MQISVVALLLVWMNALSSGGASLRSDDVILTHWGRVTHICVGKLTTIGSDNGLSPGRRQAIIWNNAGILLIGPLETNWNEILIEIYIFSFKKMHVKMSSVKWRPYCLGLNVLMPCVVTATHQWEFQSNHKNVSVPFKSYSVRWPW